jgi:hypothetical protein
VVPEPRINAKTTIRVNFDYASYYLDESRKLFAIMHLSYTHTR